MLKIAPICVVLQLLSKQSFAISDSLLDLTAAHENTCVVQKGVGLKCWGDNTDGQLGLGFTFGSRVSAEVPVGVSYPVINFDDMGFAPSQVAIGGNHICVLDPSPADTTINCWGSNSDGQLGHGNRLDFIDITNATYDEVMLGVDFFPAKIFAGQTASAALSTDGRLKIWGDNSAGQLLTGDNMDRGVSPATIGANLQPVNLGNDVNVSDVAMGFQHVCAVTGSAQLKCWGANQVGQLGLGDIASRGTMMDEIGEFLPYVDLGDNFDVAQVVVGDRHTCALSTVGSVKCWGEAHVGQLANGNGQTVGDQLGEMGNNLTFAQLGTNFTATQLTAGRSHTCALNDAGRVKCWGSNDRGQLGINSASAQGGTSMTIGDNLQFVALDPSFVVIQISAGAEHTCALDRLYNLRCWGFNELDQSGYGANTTMDSPSIGLSSSPLMDFDNLRLFDVTASPTSDPTMMPSLNPTVMPSSDPTFIPTTQPTSNPSSDPTFIPTSQPTTMPSSDPTFIPTTQPTLVPSSDPTFIPTSQPTSVPSSDPTFIPTTQPSTDPTGQPTTEPTFEPTTEPTTEPTGQPSTQPSLSPSGSPTTSPSGNPTTSPSMSPSKGIASTKLGDTTTTTEDVSPAPAMASLSPIIGAVLLIVAILYTH